MTTLHLLTDEGPVTVEFSSDLKSEHYSELFLLSSQFSTMANLRNVVSEVAERWGMGVTFAPWRPDRAK